MTIGKVTLLELSCLTVKLCNDLSLEESCDQPRQVLKSRAITLPTKVHLVKNTVFSSSHVQMWELDHKEDWALKNWCFQTVVLEKTLESPFDCQEIQPVHPKGNQSWVFFGRNNAKAETLATSWEELTHWKRLWCWEGLGAGGEVDDRGWDAWMASLTNGCESKWTPGVVDG